MAPLERKGLADAKAEFGNEAEQQPVTATMGGDGSQDGSDFTLVQTSWYGWIEMDPVEPPHRVSGDEIVTVRPGEEATSPPSSGRRSLT